MALCEKCKYYTTRSNKYPCKECYWIIQGPISYWNDENKLMEEKKKRVVAVTEIEKISIIRRLKLED